MTEIAKNKAKGQACGTAVDTTNFMRQFRDSDSLELKKLSAAQFMDVWEHYDNDGKCMGSGYPGELFIRGLESVWVP